MNTPRRHRIDRTTAEQLLAGRPVTPGTADSGLVELLAAAAAPPRPAELAGLDAAVQAFRIVQRRPAPTPRRLLMVKSLLAKFLTVKLVIAASAAGVGGVALAASTGSLPKPVQDAAHSAFGAPAGGDAQTKQPGKPTKEPSTKASHADSSPSPSFTGLCKAYNAHPMSERGNAINSSAFRALINEAGGREKVDAYCAALLAADVKSNGNGQGNDPTDKNPSSTSSPDDTPGNGNGNGHGRSDAPGKPTDAPGHP